MSQCVRMGLYLLVGFAIVWYDHTRFMESIKERRRDDKRKADLDAFLQASGTKNN